ncbi:CAP-Gly domain-containing linker protein 1-like [Xenia sp. Carnegie-2017]|uniref:CAP-Gly domain-containing linker protein 1-like n=1 Tax=Xenia sp. Carnegie-2017 TaxID=2897299 RepID=UPI001F03AA49|nr:CAP-Gly domain-containing linker protein 1-like [Xenia sp. Carnegie-2017]
MLPRRNVAFRIDVILQSVNELREEKQALEQRYTEEKNRCSGLEMKLEHESLKFGQSRDRNSKMQETVKLAEKKVGQTENQVDRLNEINDGKQNIISELNRKINEEIMQEDADIRKFQTKITQLTQHFRDAKRANDDDTLRKETQNYKESMKNVANEAKKKKNELEDVTKAFENLLVDTNQIKDLVDKKIGYNGLTLKELKVAIDQISNKQNQLEQFFHFLEACECKAKDKVNDMERIWQQECPIELIKTMPFDGNKGCSLTREEEQGFGDEKLPQLETSVQSSTIQTKINVDECFSTQTQVQDIQRNQKESSSRPCSSTVYEPFLFTPNVQHRPLNENIHDSSGEVPNENTMSGYRAASRQITSVDSPFFISLPFARSTR